MVEAKQVDLKTVDVTFDTAMEDVDKNIAVYQVVGSAKVKQVIEKVTMSEDKKVATVKVYVPFAGGATYVVEYTDLDPLTFEAATSKVEDVASLEITTTTAVVNEDTPVKFKLLNAAGVNITTTELANRVTMKSSGGVGTYFNASKNEVKIFQKDASTTITATFHTYKYDSTGKEAVVENAGLIVGVPADATNIAGLNAWTIVKDGNPKFDDVKQTIAVGDIAYRLYVEFNTKTGSKDGKVNSKDTPAKFDFTSSDKNILIIDQLGNLYPAKDGVVTVVVSYGDAGSRTVVGAIPVTVGAKRVATSLSLSSTDISLSNAAIGDEAEVEVKVKDQYGADFAYGTYKVEKLDGSPSTGRTNVTAVGSSLSGKIKFQGQDREVGTYYYRVTVGDMIGIITVTILDGSGETVSYRLQLSASTVDLKAEAGKTDKSVKVELFGYNAKGVKSSKAVLDGVNYKVSIKAPKSEHDYTATTGTAINYTLANAVSGGAINKLPVGTYEVTAEVKIEGVFVTQDVQYFTVTDSQPVPVIAEVKNRLYTKAISASALNLEGTAESSDADLIAAVKETIKFTLNGSEITTIQSVKASGFPSEVSISSVTIRQYIDNSYIDHKVAVGLTILKK
jgi:hypothetical protein